MNMRYPRSIKDGQIIHGAQFYDTSDGNFAIFKDGNDWAISTEPYGGEGNGEIIDAFDDAGLRYVRFPTRRAALEAIEVFMEANS